MIDGATVCLCVQVRLFLFGKGDIPSLLGVLVKGNLTSLKLFKVKGLLKIAACVIGLLKTQKNVLCVKVRICM